MSGRETLAVVREPLHGEAAWLVGGVIRDRLLGRGPATDIDVVLDGDVRGAARRLARASGAVAFELSGEFGAWRVVARDHSWQADLNPIRGGSLEADLRLRDFTINAIAQPIAGGDLVDPLGGVGDLAGRRLRLAAPDAVRADPLRALRLVRLACELQLEPDATAAEAARSSAAGLRGVAAERVFGELKRIVTSERAPAGLELAGGLGLTAVVLPELDALGGVEQSRFHHKDVLGHTLEALTGAIALERDPAAFVGDAHAERVRAILAEPLADDLTRAGGLRLGALMHDIAKPPTRRLTPDGRVQFRGHDERGAQMARGILGRLRTSERLAAHVGALVAEHLRLGFMVKDHPLSRRAVYRYLDACDGVAVDVTLLSIVDRLATRGEGAEPAIERHLTVARGILGEALRWHADGRPAPVIRGDRLARELGIEPGPDLGGLLARLAEAQFAGEASTPEAALALARLLI
ncbi:MAG: poly(A) polymerase [Solirubrobacteraceae bacterium]|jgi:putative nucleotidyltransferase with HDIG domain|nr:poly(A) polymerase [Solirubrobacteraceae bacterium]